MDIFFKTHGPKLLVAVLSSILTYLSTANGFVNMTIG